MALASCACSLPQDCCIIPALTPTPPPPFLAAGAAGGGACLQAAHAQHTPRPAALLWGQGLLRREGACGCAAIWCQVGRDRTGAGIEESCQRLLGEGGCDETLLARHVSVVLAAPVPSHDTEVCAISLGATSAGTRQLCLILSIEAADTSNDWLLPLSIVFLACCCHIFRRYSGPTVHFVDEEYDTGPILAQRVVDVYPTDTPKQLAARVLEQVRCCAVLRCAVL